MHPAAERALPAGAVRQVKSPLIPWPKHLARVKKATTAATHSAWLIMTKAAVEMADKRVDDGDVVSKL